LWSLAAARDRSFAPKMFASAHASTKPRPDASLRRVLLVSVVLLCWMLLISARLVQLQVSEHDNLSDRARKQQQGAIETGPSRGQVLDRQGRELARSVDTESFYADPNEVSDPEQTATAIARVTGVDRIALAAHIKEALASNRRFVWVARRLDERQAEKLRSLNLDGLYPRKEPKRYYPNDALAAHVLGFVGFDEIGLGGIEQYYNEQIRGEAGKLYLETDARHRAFESYEVQARPGQIVSLTIDQNVQYRTEQALAAAVQRTHAKSGSAIVLDPHTGEILALANAPAFNPNDPLSASPQARVNGALQNIYEPGSTFKVVAYSAAIEKGLVKPEDHIDCQMGKIDVFGRIVHDHHPFGLLTVAEALAKSSNVGAIKLGLRVGDQSMYDYITHFGFGSRTGVDLPGESGGLLRPLDRWQPSSIGSIAMGQEIGVTALQMAVAFGVLANGGMLIKPHLVREIRSSEGMTLFHAKLEEHRALKSETTAALRRMLEGVTLAGTGRKAELNGYTAAGKTGTAQKIDPRTRTYSRTKYVGSFVGFAPVENPAVVIIVVIDEPVGSYHGGDVAAPVFREIAEQVLPGLEVAPDVEITRAPELVARARISPAKLDEEREQQTRKLAERRATFPEVAAAYAPAGTEVIYALATKHATLMPDLRGQSVKDVSRLCAQLGLQVEAAGEGRALRQSPAPGAEIESGQSVRVEFGRRNQ
jgi:cell division protein FtsI/penicillin-binding protein 2